MSLKIYLGGFRDNMALSEVYPPKSEQDTLRHIIMAVSYLIHDIKKTLSTFVSFKRLTAINK